MPRDTTASRRYRLDSLTYADPREVLSGLVASANLSDADRRAISAMGAGFVRDIRRSADPGLMEVFLAEYGLSTDEGVALMCLAEALLRVPDADTIDALIEDKIAPSDWGRHLGQSTSSLVNASTWALMLTGRVLEDGPPGPVGHLRGAIKRLGEPVIRAAVTRAMKEMGRLFVLGEDIAAAMDRAAAMEAKGFTYSYDMLGEAARTEADAERYTAAYGDAIAAISGASNSSDIRRNPGISVKLSALHPRYEVAQEASVMAELAPRLRALCLAAKAAGIGLNIDAEEADRLSLSLDVVEAVLADPALAGWDGLGVVVQAYGPRAGAVIDAIYEMACRHDRRLMVRLVKGAYWDTEIKRAQVEGMEGFPVFITKAATDVSYIANARKLLAMTDRIYPQFATHNAHTVAAILHMSVDREAYEFQRLHGMGEALHTAVMAQHGTRCRIYAPVGAHRDLLAYLVRRLLENGANSSFVNQLVDEDVAPETIAADPFLALDAPQPPIRTGAGIFAPERRNSRGFDLTHAPTLVAIDVARAPFRQHRWHAAPLLAAEHSASDAQPVENPSDAADTPGSVTPATQAEVTLAFDHAAPWTAPMATRRAVLLAAADALEEAHGELFALLAREAGKTLPDAVAELREAVDFLRYYAEQAIDAPPAGVFACIAPWNFPLAIFLGQVAAALAAGNAVLAKPAEQTPLIAYRAVQILHGSGVPRSALQLLPGGGAVGAALTQDPRVSGSAFTGSTATALKIRASLADNAEPGAPLIAETGGLNAMIVDSTALPEQAVEAVIESAFQSAGQRCSALRCLYVQEDIAGPFIEMLVGAMEVLRVGQPWDLATDVGPIIDAAARAKIVDYVKKAFEDNRVIAEVKALSEGCFVAPTLIRIGGIADLEEEIFGPVLHIATFRADELDRVIDDINATGYGLTFGLHSRIDDRVQHVSNRIKAGNVYVNRNQIGAIVGSQPFGGEGLSGTGPKAGGPSYLKRFAAPERRQCSGDWTGAGTLPPLAGALAAPLKTVTLPGPTGESNRLSLWPRAPLLCLGPGAEASDRQVKAVQDMGGKALAVNGNIDPAALQTGPAYGGVIWWGDAGTARALARALAAREGPIVPLITGAPDEAHVLVERHVSVDTTAAGGNVALLGEVGARP